MAPKLFDVLVLHVAEDRDEVAVPLARALERLGLAVRVDDQQVQLGDQLRTKIKIGLRRSRFAVVVLSRAFVNKGWLPADVDGMLGYETWIQETVLLLRHGLSAAEFSSLHPVTTERLLLDTDQGVAVVADILAERTAAGRRELREKAAAILKTLDGLERRAIACFNRTTEIDNPNPSTLFDPVVAANVVSQLEYDATDLAIASYSMRTLGRFPTAEEWTGYGGQLVSLERSGNDPRTARAAFQNQLEWIQLSRVFVSSLGEA